MNLTDETNRAILKELEELRKVRVNFLNSKMTPIFCFLLQLALNSRHSDRRHAKLVEKVQLEREAETSALVSDQDFEDEENACQACKIRQKQVGKIRCWISITRGIVQQG